MYHQEKTFVSTNYVTEISQNQDTEECEEGYFDNCEMKDPFEAKYDTKQPFVAEHHILWSMSYGVPVLYFNGWFSG